MQPAVFTSVKDVHLPECFAFPQDCGWHHEALLLTGTLLWGHPDIFGTYCFSVAENPSSGKLNAD